MPHIKKLESSTISQMYHNSFPFKKKPRKSNVIKRKTSYFRPLKMLAWRIFFFFFGMMKSAALTSAALTESTHWPAMFWLSTSIRMPYHLYSKDPLNIDHCLLRPFQPQPKPKFVEFNHPSNNHKSITKVSFSTIIHNIFSFKSTLLLAHLVLT